MRRTETNHTWSGFLIDLDIAIGTDRPDTDAFERSQRTRSREPVSFVLVVLRFRSSPNGAVLELCKSESDLPFGMDID